MKSQNGIALIASVVLLAACSGPISKEEKARLKAPVNCATAQQDIETLKKEKSSNVERAANGITSVLPIGLVAGVVSGTAGDKADVALGVYNDQIDAKIAEIKSTCGI